MTGKNGLNWIGNRVLASRVTACGLVSFALLALTLALAIGCNSSKSRISAHSSLSSSGAARALSIEQAIEEARAYIPPGEAASPADFDPLVFEMLRAELIRALEARKGEKICSAVATGDDISIPDILVNPLPSGANEIIFSEVVLGDYDSNGEVGIPDITPIANHYLHLSNDGVCDDALDSKIDGDGDGEVGISDITPIANNYLIQSPAAGAGSLGYDVWRMPADGVGDAELMTNVAESAAGVAGYGETRVFSVIDSDPVRGASSYPVQRPFGSVQRPVLGAPWIEPKTGLGTDRWASSVDSEGNGYANGDYVYYISPHEDGSPDSPPSFAVTVEHQGDFRFAGAPASCRIVVKTWGELTPLSYTMDWGVPDNEYTPVPMLTSDPLYQFTFTYTRPGIYFPEATVTGTVRGVEMSITQVAAPVIVQADVPYAPTGLSVSQLGNDVSLNWDVVDPDDHDGFRVYYSMKRGDSRPILLGETAKTANTFQTDLNGMLSNVAADHPVFFKVTAFVQGDGTTTQEVESKFSNEFNWPVTDIQAPMLDFSNANDNEINLTWTPVISTATYTVQGYRIYKGDEPGDASPELISGVDPLPANANTFSYYPVAEDMQLYFYAVTVTNIGESARSNEKYWSRSGLPIANANAVPLTGAPPLSVDFNANGSYDADGVIVEYAWKFFTGDTYHDYSAEDGVAAFEYADPGVYTAILRVTDDDGKYAFDRAIIAANIPPIAVAAADPTSGNAPLTVNFDASGSNDPGGAIAKYEWDFDGDGTYDWESAVSGNLQYTYTNYGDYSAMLRVTDDLGAAITDTIDISVNAPPIAVTNADTTSGYAPLTVNFNADGSYDPDGTIIKWEWDWTSDGTYDWESTTDGNAQHIYTTAGEYTAKLRAWDNNGVAATDSIGIIVRGEAEWHIETVDSEGDVGRYPCIALDSNDLPNISYYDIANSALKCGIWNGLSWYIEIIDSLDSGVRYTSIVLDSDDNAHISYYDAGLLDLKYAHSVDAAWDIVTLDSEGGVGGYSSIEIDSNDHPHISYWDQTNANIMYTKWDGISWITDVVASTGGLVSWTSLSIDSNNIPHISFFDYNNLDLKYASWNGLEWIIDTVDYEGDVGWWPSIAVDSSNSPCISYWDQSEIAMKCAKWNGVSWDISVVDSEIGAMGMTSIAIDSLDKPHISYSEDQLKYAKWNGSEWNVETIDSAGFVAFQTQVGLSLDSYDHPHIAYYDVTNGDLKYAWFG